MLDERYPSGTRVHITMPGDATVWGTVLNEGEVLAAGQYKVAEATREDPELCIMARWDDDGEILHCESKAIMESHGPVYSICAECDAHVMDCHYLCGECRV